jgi:DNA-binding Lrp family transcriptional regulator
MRPLFVLIKCEMGRAYETAGEAVDRIPEVSEIYSISGQYDLLGKFYLDPGQDPGLFVTEKVQRLPGVKDTFTLITFNAFSGGAASGGTGADD